MAIPTVTLSCLLDLDRDKTFYKFPESMYSLIYLLTSMSINLIV